MLNLPKNSYDPDELYEMFLQMYQGLSEQQSLDFNASLILVLAHYIGDANIVREAIAIAKKSLHLSSDRLPQDVTGGIF